MIRRAVLFLITMLASPALAGHYTHDRVIGFSEDGQYFAFETYGLQRGSGLPYANIFVIDLANNSWVTDTPVRRRSEESDMAAVEAAPYAALQAIRAEALDAAQPVLTDLNIRRPATVLYAAGIGQAYQAPQVTHVTIPNPDDPTAEPWGAFSLGLSEVSVPAASESCTRVEDLRGYRLEFIPRNGIAQVLHEDQRIPASRGCADAYRLDAVVSAGFPQADASLVALISVWTQGFEGLSRHVIAAPIPSPGQMQADQDPETLLADFMRGMDPLDIDALNENLVARHEPDPNALFWPDADLPPIARAAEAIGAQDGFADHGRLMFRMDQAEIIPEGAGGPMTFSLIRVQSFNLGAARHAELHDIFGENTAPPEAFGPGPDIEWRFVMRPVQGMRADIIAAGRREITQGETPDCGPSSCQSAAPLDSDSLGFACETLDPTPVQGAATQLGQALSNLATQNQTTWLVEHDLWQDDAMQIVAGQAGQMHACWLGLYGPD